MDEVKRILHIAPAVSREASGPSYSVLRLCDLLIVRGQDVALAVLDLAPMAAPPSYLRAFPPGLGPRRLGRSPELKGWLDEEVLAGRVDILHNHGMWQMNALYPGWAAKKGRAKLVVSPRGAFSRWAMQHGSKSKGLFWRLLQKPALQQAACFHATCEAELADIRRLGFRQPVAVIANGIDLPALPGIAKHAPRTLLFLGRIHPVKGLDLLLPAWLAVQDAFPDWQLVVVGGDGGYHGSDGYAERMQAWAGRHRLQRVQFSGELRGPDKLLAYRRAELFVLPSYSENFGVTVAEALAAATPAIVSKGAPWRGLPGRDAGWWVEVGVEPLAACLRQALSCSAGRLEQMGRNGRDWMAADFSWSQAAGRMHETYRWLLGESATKPVWVVTD